jgi:peptidyl-prolyl cis-trans isomerase C
MNRKLLAVVLITLSASLAQAAYGADTSESIATVNGKAIPKARADALLAGQFAQGKEDTEDLRKAVKEELIRREVLVQAAEKKGLDKKPEIMGQMMMARQGVLIGGYLNDYVKSHPVTDEMLKKEYESIRQTLGNKEYKARHILVDKEDEAKAIIAGLKKGDKFEDLAKQSKDPGSKDRGGDLGWANQAAYVKPFSDAMVKLEKGQYTEAPVKTDFGWHVIMLDDTRDLKAPPLEEVKAQLTQRLQQQMIEKHVLDLRTKAKVE